MLELQQYQRKRKQSLTKDFNFQRKKDFIITKVEYINYKRKIRKVQKNFSFDKNFPYPTKD